MTDHIDTDQPTRFPDPPKYVTILDVAKARGAHVDEAGMINGAEFDRLGLAIVGGCSRCHATIAAYNAYPSLDGCWKCEDCIWAGGFESVGEFERWCELRDARPVFSEFQTATFPDVCPFCEQTSDYYADDAETYDDFIGQDISCNRCGGKWRLHWKPDGWTPVETPGGYVYTHRRGIYTTEQGEN